MSIFLYVFQSDDRDICVGVYVYILYFLWFGYQKLKIIWSQRFGDHYLSEWIRDKETRNNFIFMISLKYSLEYIHTYLKMTMKKTNV